MYENSPQNIAAGASALCKSHSAVAEVLRGLWSDCLVPICGRVSVFRSAIMISCKGMGTISWSDISSEVFYGTWYTVDFL